MNKRCPFVIGVHISPTVLQVSDQRFFFHRLEPKLVGFAISMPEAHTEIWGKDRPKETYLQPANEDSPVCSCGLPWRRGGRRRRKKMRREDNFPWGNFSTQHSNQGREGGWGGSGVRRKRENRPNGGKGWAQQPEAACRGQRAAQNHLREVDTSSRRDGERMLAEAVD